MRNNRAWMSLMTACVAAVLLLSLAPAAQAHGRDNLWALMWVDGGPNPDGVVGLGSLETRRVHYRLNVRTCLQARWYGEWHRMECHYERRRHARVVNASVADDCVLDTYYRVRVHGWVKDRSGHIGHRSWGTSSLEYYDCP